MLVVVVLQGVYEGTMRICKDGDYIYPALQKYKGLKGVPCLPNEEMPRYLLFPD